MLIVGCDFDFFLRKVFRRLFYYERQTFSINIVADCVALFCQVTEKLKRATALGFTTVSAIIFIHCVCPA